MLMQTSSLSNLAPQSFVWCARALGGRVSLTIAFSLMFPLQRSQFWCLFGLFAVRAAAMFWACSLYTRKNLFAVTSIHFRAGQHYDRQSQFQWPSCGLVPGPDATLVWVMWETFRKDLIWLMHMAPGPTHKPSPTQTLTPRFCWQLQTSMCGQVVLATCAPRPPWMFYSQDHVCVRYSSQRGCNPHCAHHLAVGTVLCPFSSQPASACS